MSKVISTTVTFGKYTRESLDSLTAAGHQVLLNQTGTYYTEQELCQLGLDNPDTEALIVGSELVNQEVINVFPNLKIIAMHGVGTDKIDLAYARFRDIVVTNTPGANSIDVAEYVIGLIIVFNRQLQLGMAEMKAGVWAKKVGRRLSGQTLGIIGVGKIGIELAKRATHLGMTVYGYDPYPNELALEFGLRYTSMAELLQQSDVISLHSPVIKGEPPIIDRESLKLIKPEAVVINAARDPLVDLGAIEEALLANRLAGFITDVYDVEPPLPSPLWQYDSVIMTPHGGGGTIEANTAMGEMATANVLAVLNGQAALNPVN